MEKYSVLLLYPDYIADVYGEETYYTHVEAMTPAQAVDVAQKEAWAFNERTDDDPGDASDFAPLLVTSGHHYGHSWETGLPFMEQETPC